MKKTTITIILIFSIFQMFAQQTGTLTDARDGQVYETVKIGDQWWMAENLNYKAYNSWWYENSENNGDIYGRLYTWEVSINICPIGWQLPTFEDYLAVINLYGGEKIAGKELKKGGYSGFDALNAGCYENKEFDNLGSQAYFWTSSSNYTNGATVLGVKANSNVIWSDIGTKSDGFSVRCIKE